MPTELPQSKRAGIQVFYGVSYCLVFRGFIRFYTLLKFKSQIQLKGPTSYDHQRILDQAKQRTKIDHHTKTNSDRRRPARSLFWTGDGSGSACASRRSIHYS